MKDLWISFAVGAAVGLVALMAMLFSAESMPVLVAIAFVLLGSIAVSLVRLGPGIRHLVTGMERDRVEIAKATEELKRFVVPDPSAERS